MGIKNFKRFIIRKNAVCILTIFSVLATCFSAVFPLNCYAQNDDNFDIEIYYENGHTLKYSDVDEELLAQFIKEYKRISSSKQKWIKSTNAASEYSIVIYEGSLSYRIQKYVSSYEGYIEIDGNYYDVSDNLDSLIEALSQSGATMYMEPDEYLLTYTTSCDEPQTEDEYIAAAQDITGQWLEYLKTTKGEYRIRDYSFEKNYAANKSRLLADGYVNGLREWTVEVRFDVEGIPGNSVFYDETGYNTYYSYYFGPMVILRLRWQDGVCSVVDYDYAYMGAMYGGSLLDNLYGVRTSESSYDTFYEFMNDSENVNSYLNNGVYSKLISGVVSHNVLMLSNGSVYYVDIGGSSSYNPLSYSDGVYTGQFARQFYDVDGSSTYGSPVTYDDSTQSPTTISFSEDFSLIFDDYNHDGNPDYTIKIDEDDNGSTYYVSCMSNDGTPRANPYNNEIYLAGCFDDSVRLQRYENGYVYWHYEDGRLTSNQELDDYRMYSQRYYEPEGLNSYKEGTENVICYLWNNTDEAVQLGSSYDIEGYVNGDWVSVAAGLSLSGTDIINDDCLGSTDSQTSGDDKFVSPYSHIAISFDVSEASNTNADANANIAGNEYRIVLQLEDGKTVYGGFYMGEGDSDGDMSSDGNDSGWYHFEDNPPIEKDSDGATVTLENKISTEEAALNVRPRSFYVLNNGKWEPQYCDIELVDAAEYSPDVGYGEAVAVRISDGDISYSATPSSLHRYVFFGSAIESLGQIASGIFGEEKAEKLSNNLFSLYLALELLSLQQQSSQTSTKLPKDGDICRLELTVDDYSEFVYFTY
jgi:hypothetical protein